MAGFQPKRKFDETGKIILGSGLLGITVLYLMADKLIPQPFEPFAFRASFRLYTGIVAMMAMSACMILAARPAFLQNYLNGLDKSYRLHKWLGITALVAAMLHFWVANVIKWGSEWGWYPRPPKSSPAPGNALETWLYSLKDAAENVGEWMFYLSAALMIVALVKWIPYRWFVKYHKWLAVAYLALVFHAIVLMKFTFWTQPISWVSSIFMLCGSIAAIWILMGKTGKSRQFDGTIKNIIPLPNSQAVQLNIHIPKWQGHQAGQFAFLHHEHSNEKPHPFTLSSAWRQNGEVSMLIKNLGDYTAHIAEHFHIGDTVRLEGAYGTFTMNDAAPVQIWIAGGIGITPFLAKLEALAHTSANHQTIYLFYSYQTADDALLTQIRQAAKQAQVNLYLHDSTQKGHLSSADIIHPISHWQQASVWFCGNKKFATTIKQGLRQQGWHGIFHQEQFEMR